MEKVIGGIMGLAAFLAVIVAAVLRHLSLTDSLWRATVAGVLGFVLGWLLFGKIGVEMAKGSAVPPESAPPKPPPPAPPEKK